LALLPAGRHSQERRRRVVQPHDNVDQDGGQLSGTSVIEVVLASNGSASPPIETALWNSAERDIGPRFASQLR
jgi:hypothetical protein